MSVKTTPENMTASPDVNIYRGLPWMKIVSFVGVFVILMGFAARYYKNSFIGLTTRNSMDIAQIARNIVEHRGYTTRFVRPLNVAILPPFVDEVPEVNHSPLYPYAVSKMFRPGSYSEQAVVRTSMAFIVLTMIATFLLGMTLFDWRVGLLAASLFGLSSRILNVGMLGEEWSMSAFFFTLLLTTIGLHHRHCLIENRGKGSIYAAISAVLFSMLYMTHQSLFVLIVPLIIYFAVTGSNKRQHALIFALVAVLLVSPWVYRNLKLTGSPIFGMNTWDIMSNNNTYPGDVLYRSTDTNIVNPWRALLYPVEHFRTFSNSFFTRLNGLLSAAVSMLGLVIGPFAAVSILYRFKKPSANAVRGLVYGMAVITIATLAILNVDANALLMFMSIAAVIGSAYFLLLLEAKKLHSFFIKTLLGAIIFFAAVQALPSMFWNTTPTASATEISANDYFQMLSGRGYSTDLFTDIPWIAAWRTTGIAIWLPRTEDDVALLSAKNYPLQIIVLTYESDNYPDDEIWYSLHRIRLWRDYIKDPKTGLKEILKEANITDEKAKGADKYFQRLNRQFAISESIAGFEQVNKDPLAPDDVLVLVTPHR